MNARSLMGLLVVALLPATVDAGLLRLDDAVHGASSIVLDTDSNLEWLQPLTTRSMSMSDVNSELAPGGAYEGFRYAASGEVEELLENFGFSAMGSGRADQDVDLTRDFLDIFSPTTKPSKRLDMVVGVSDGKRIKVVLDDPDAWVTFSPASISDDWEGQSLGHWLVRDAQVLQGAAPVPEPTTLALTALGLSGVAASRRRRKQS